MSAIFAANATISAQQNNGPNSMHAIRRKCRCLGLLLPACFPSFEATSRLILFSFKMTYTARTSKLPLTEQHRANAFFLGWAAILLQVHNVDATKPTITTSPLRHRRMCTPIFFRHG